MYARVNEFSGTAEQLEKSLSDTQTISDKLEGIPGSLGMYYLVDYEGGKAIAITLWETEDALRASEEAAGGIRQETSAVEGTQVVAVGRYEVVANTARMPART
jgi:hypothetical protein